jgi:Putative zinc-finger
MSHLGERLSALIDGELTAAQRDRVLTHLVRCEPCRREAASLRLLKQRMRTLGEATAGDALHDRLMALAGQAGGPAGRLRERRGMAEPLSWWPVRSIALTALVLLALGLPAAAFVAGGSQQAPGPSVTPPVAMFMTQHAINTGAVPATSGPEARASAQPSPGAATSDGRTVRPADGQAGALGPVKAAVTGRSSPVRARGQRAARPPSRRDPAGPPSRRTPRHPASGQRVTPGGG